MKNSQNIINLRRNLRRNILRGQPWLYREALDTPHGLTGGLVQVHDGKGFLAWGIYSSQGPLALRVLSLQKKSPDKQFIANKVYESLARRRGVLCSTTNACRWIHGEGDGLPGVICDKYGDVAVLQYDGDEMHSFWQQQGLVQILLETLPVEFIYLKSRNKSKYSAQWVSKNQSRQPNQIKIQENGVQFCVDIIDGQKTGFFLDQRHNRNFIKSLAKDKTVLNLFSYTGGFSVYCGLAGAKQVTSVDMAPSAVEMAEKNWQLNGLDSNKHKTVTLDVFEYLENLSSGFDIVICDPPSLAKNEKNKKAAVQAYTALFAQVIKKTNRGGVVALSSCSSHISYEDFFEIITEAFSSAKARGRVLWTGTQGEDHPYPHSFRELQYLKFVALELY